MVSGLLIGVIISTTALGTLVPILRDTRELETPFGSFVLAAGTMGELGPILLVSILLAKDHSGLTQSVLLFAFAAIALLVAFVALHVHPPRVLRLLCRTMFTSAQLPVRLSVLLLLALALLAENFGLDMILGAFTAGIVVGYVVKGQRPGHSSGYISRRYRWQTGSQRRVSDGSRYRKSPREGT